MLKLYFRRAIFRWVEAYEQRSELLHCLSYASTGANIQGVKAYEQGSELLSGSYINSKPCTGMYRAASKRQEVVLRAVTLITITSTEAL